MEHQTYERLEGYIGSVLAKLDNTSLHHPAVILPGNCAIVSTEHLLERPVSLRGEFLTSSMDSFHSYVQANKGHDSVVFIDRDAMAAVGVFDHAGDDGAGWGRHKAVLKPQMTPEYKALLANARPNKVFTQREMADWINDWSHALTFIERDGNDGAEKDMSISRTIQAVQKIDVKQKQNVASEDSNFRAARTKMEEIEIGGEIKLPDRMVMTCEPYVGFDARKIFCRMIAFWDDSKVTLGYRIDGLEHTTDEISAEFQRRVSEDPRMGNTPVFLGTFSRNK